MKKHIQAAVIIGLLVFSLATTAEADRWSWSALYSPDPFGNEPMFVVTPGATEITWQFNDEPISWAGHEPLVAFSMYVHSDDQGTIINPAADLTFFYNISDSVVWESSVVPTDEIGVNGWVRFKTPNPAAFIYPGDLFSVHVTIHRSTQHAMAEYIGISSTPEPATMLLLGAGLLGLWGFRRKFRK